jgi:hypothetical protein
MRRTVSPSFEVFGSTSLSGFGTMTSGVVDCERRGGIVDWYLLSEDHRKHCSYMWYPRNTVPGAQELFGFTGG